jgi:hypothetical protein
MTDRQGFAAFEKRIAALLRQSAHLPPAAIISLLRRADANPSLDVEKELRLLRRKFAPRRRKPAK